MTPEMRALSALYGLDEIERMDLAAARAELERMERELWEQRREIIARKRNRPPDARIHVRRRALRDRIELLESAR